MDFQRMVREFREDVETMKTRDFRELLPERKFEKARHFQVTLIVDVNPKFGGNLEDKLTKIRSITGVTIVSSDPTERRNVYKMKIKFHPEYESMRPSTYVRTVLIPDINSNKKIAGARVLTIQPNSLKSIN